MKRLNEKFVLKHTTKFLLMGVNALFWKGTERCYTTYITKSFPVFSLCFYEQYGDFAPISPNLVLSSIRDKKVSLEQLTSLVRWDEFVIDVISFFRLNTLAKQKTRNILLTRFRKCFEKVCKSGEFVSPFHDALKRGKLFFDFGDEKLLVLLEFKQMIDYWAFATGSEIFTFLQTNIRCSEDEELNSEEYYSKALNKVRGRVLCTIKEEPEEYFLRDDLKKCEWVESRRRSETTPISGRYKLIKCLF